ncbi:MAG: ornithine-acyl-ACP acyltransferase [Rhodobacterales bacterium]|nr:MAG: ornithine-acyl-ACP acyltransferase [Rhodobacterales bacterium]PIE12693.1 MAG: ornithine-acyl-ACP acyltransferase [Rhodobacterales bacterium]
MAEEGRTLLQRAGCRVRLAAGVRDVLRAQELRFRAFRDPAGGGRDADAFDAQCAHLLVEDAGGALLATCRLMPFASGSGIAASYSAQFYDLSALSGFGGAMLELGRFCAQPGSGGADAVRLAWAGLTRLVDAEGIEMLFGCTSFPGTEAAPHAEAFAFLAARHGAPARWAPGERATEVVRFGGGAFDPARARAGLPPLLRSYLLMGGWVSDHAVVDRDLGTLHVFTGLEIGAVPANRQALLRAAAQ